jgi:hypothetical protein
MHFIGITGEVSMGAWWKRQIAACVTLVAVAPACSAQARNETTAAQEAGVHNRLTAEEQQQGWRLLFDGRTLDGWRGYKSQAMPAGWAVVDEALTRVSRSGDIITTEPFRDFELRFEWKTNAGGNSGIFYRVIEGDGPIYHYAPEYQILDDERHGDGADPLTSAGANYAINPAPRGVVKPVGEWNTARIVVRDNHVEHWLNEQKIVEYEFGSADWQERVAKSKFAQWPSYGKAPQGHLGIQGDHGWVALRNVKIRAF